MFEVSLKLKLLNRAFLDVVLLRATASKIMCSNRRSPEFYQWLGSAKASIARGLSKDRGCA